MESIREYLIGVIAAALLCGLVSQLIEPKGTVGIAVKLVAGFLMLLAVLRPWVELRPEGLFRLAEDFAADGSSYVTQGQQLANDFYRDGIRKRLTAYIVDEAKTYGCDLSVEVFLTDDDIPKPHQICLSGDISPYARQALTNSLIEKLGLTREDLIWT
ncbi:MAG: hypothetical protein E7447_05230 [Ruminococcaceae bacterium]|nr:hypothetical protein [Oscillospiraceae bacterium]